jgi:ATP-dependent RNA helicase DeaD
LSQFDDLPLSLDLKKSLGELKFIQMFPIQAEAIPTILRGSDVIGQAHTGTGKTGAYALPMLERLSSTSLNVEGLVIVPTRELAKQVAEDIQSFGKYTSFKVLPVYGGQSIEVQIEKLRRRVQIIVGTPGRLIDHLRRRSLDLSHVKLLVLDEADRMLEMGFVEDVIFILEHIPRNRQTCLFSATMPEEVLGIAERYMRNPEKILIDKDEIALEEIEQLYCVVEQRRKFKTLCELIDQFKIRRAIIFCGTKLETDRLAEQLERQQYSTLALHADLTQSRRDYVMDRFESGSALLLVATELAARGLDIEKVDYIINYDVPRDPLMYFHRIGRTARAGNHGTAITLVTYEEGSELEEIRSMTNTDLKELVEKSPGLFTDENYFRRENSKWVPKDENGLRSLIERV